MSSSCLQKSVSKRCCAGGHQRFLTQLHQRCALQAILAGTASEGFQVAEQRTSQDGSIELVVTRWQD
jgi:hypothetical protein